MSFTGMIWLPLALTLIAVIWGLWPRTDGGGVPMHGGGPFVIFAWIIIAVVWILYGLSYFIIYGVQMIV